MPIYPQTGTEFSEQLLNNVMAAWFDYCVWFYLQNKFYGPARMMAKNDEMQEWLNHFSLNGIRSNICKPY